MGRMDDRLRLKIQRLREGKVEMSAGRVSLDAGNYSHMSG